MAGLLIHTLFTKYHSFSTVEGSRSSRPLTGAEALVSLSGQPSWKGSFRYQESRTQEVSIQQHCLSTFGREAKVNTPGGHRQERLPAVRE